MMAVVSISLFFIYIFCLWSLYQGVTRAQKLVCLLRKTILINSQVSEHYFMDFLEKRECFGLTHSLGCVYPTLYIIRLLGRVYHFSLLICYPCPFITRNTFGLVSARSYKIVVVGNNRLVG